jgi:hypothetical protein
MEKDISSLKKAQKHLKESAEIETGVDVASLTQV